MIDPSLALQGAIVTALKSSVSVRAVIGNPARIYDNVPSGAVFPYASLGSMQIINDSNDCGDQSDVFASVDCWSRAVGFPEVRSVAAAIAAVLANAVAVPGFRVVFQYVEDINYRRDPDGLTSRATIGLRYSLVAVP